MPEVNGRTLLMAVQAVHAEMLRIRGDVDLGDLEPDDQELLFSYSRAAEELKRAYLEARLSFTNLPPYEDLVAPA
jgi:hypothetical protein